MDVIVLQSEAFAELQRNTFTHLQQLMQEECKAPEFGWLSNKQVIELLGASPRTVQSWRDEGLIGFSQVGKKIYYSREEVDRMLKHHYHKPFKAVA